MRADGGLVGLQIGPMHRDTLPEYVVVTDAQPRRCAFVLEILGSLADHAAGKELIVGSDFRPSGQVGMWSDDAIRANFNLGIDYRKWTDLDARPELGVGMNNSRRMNHRGKKAATGTIAKPKLPSVEVH